MLLVCRGSCFLSGYDAVPGRPLRLRLWRGVPHIGAWINICRKGGEVPSKRRQASTQPPCSSQGRTDAIFYSGNKVCTVTSLLVSRYRTERITVSHSIFAEPTTSLFGVMGRYALLPGGYVYRGEYFADIIYGAYVFGDNSNR